MIYIPASKGKVDGGEVANCDFTIFQVLFWKGGEENHPTFYRIGYLHAVKKN